MKRIDKNFHPARQNFMSFPPQWNDLQAFQAVLETGSLSAAARRLHLSQPTVRARIDALEHALGAVLFTRSANGLVATEAARGLAGHLQTMKTASEALVRGATGEPGVISGNVRISASEIVASSVLPSMLAALRAKHPRLHIELAPSNASIDLISQEADIAIRMFRPQGEGLVARKIGDIRLGFYASRAYAAARGLPTTIDELASHDLIGPDRTPYDHALLRAFAPDFVDRPFVLRTDSHTAQLAAIRAGVGIGIVQRPLADADPDLVAVLPEQDFAALETFIVTHGDLRRLPKIRAAFDWLVESFTAYLAGHIPAG